MTHDQMFNEFLSKLNAEGRDNIDDYKSISGCGIVDMVGGIGVWFKDGSKIIYIPNDFTVESRYTKAVNDLKDYKIR